MLVLTRKVGERVIIGADIAITVVEMGGGRVKLGIEAPKSVPIIRAELSPFVVGRVEQRAEACAPRTEGGAE